MNSKLAKSLPALALLIFVMLVVCLLSCEQSKPPESEYYHLVHRENSDGTVTQWEVHTKIEIFGPCICWEDKTGGKFCISGPYITIVPVKIDHVVVVPSE
jgi:hypothetical protein